MTHIIIKDKIEELITRLARAIQIARIYTEEHDLTVKSIDQLYQILNDILLDKGEITIGIIGEEIAFEKEPLYELSMKKKGFIKYLKSIGVKKISFQNGLEKKELFQFTKILGTKADPSDKTQTLEQRLYATHIRHITIGDIGFANQQKADQSLENIQESPPNNYRENVKLLTQTFKRLKGNQSLNVQSARQIVDGLINNLLKNKNLLLMLSSIKGYDESTFEHGINVGIFTLLQAEMLGIEEKYMTNVGMAALLHDIGKLTEPLEEMNGEEKRSDEKSALKKEENQFLQDVKGAKILLDTEGIDVLPAIVAFEHNIHFDGSGGPKRLYGKDLNLISMMIAISDYYDKLRRKPSFYEGGGPEKAYKDMMELSGKRFHPDLLNNFFSVIGVYPPGILVELDTKEIGLVIQASIMDIKRPQIEILYDRNGEKLKEPFIANLAEKNNQGQYVRTIIKSITPLDQNIS